MSQVSWLVFAMFIPVAVLSLWIQVTMIVFSIHFVMVYMHYHFHVFIFCGFSSKARICRGDVKMLYSLCKALSVSVIKGYGMFLLSLELSYYLTSLDQ